MKLRGLGLLVSSSSFILGTLALSGCGAGAAAEAVRPDAPTGSTALGEPICGDVSKGGEPLVVDWKPEQRGDLEIAMKDGIAVVAYSCGGIKVLTECKLAGEYGFIGMTSREQVVRLQNGDEVKANLPLSGVSLSGELSRGSTLDIAMMIVGKRRTTWDVPSKDDLVGSCDGATHFVRGATVGAFAMGTGTEAKVRAAAEIFGFGGDAGSSSSKSTANRDGDINDCKKATPDATSAPQQCGAPIRLVLAPIAKSAEVASAAAKESSKAVAVSESNNCPSGMVFTEGKCAPKAAAKSYECKPGDKPECQAQCDAGNAVSCGLLGEIEANASDTAGAIPHFKKACEGGHARSCANYGLLAKGDDAPASFEKACDGGDGIGCRELARVASDDDKGFALAQKACDGGDAEGCALLAARHADGKGTSKDRIKAGFLYKRACDGGHLPSCRAAGLALSSGPGGNEMLASFAFQRGCVRQDWASCTGLGRTQYAREPESAKRSFEQACNFGRDALACSALKVLYGGNTPVMPDMKMEQAAEAGCRSGNAYDCTSAGLLQAGKGMVPMARTNLQQACTRGDKLACEVQKKLP